MSAIDKLFTELRAAKRKALMPFVTAGDPDLAFTAAVLKELSKIAQGGVSQDELKRAKDYFMGQFLLGLEDTMDHMLWIGETVISRDRVRSPEDVVREIKKVKSTDIQRIARLVFNPRRLNLSVVGPLTDSQEQELRRLMKCA